MPYRKALSWFLLTAIILQIIGIPSQAVAAESTVTFVSEEPLTSGAILKKYVWNSVRNNTPVKTDVKVIQVDLKNPLVKLDVMTGTNNQFTKKNTVRNMANETAAVGGVNGDFYNTQAEGVPIGPQISNGQLMATAPDLKGFYSFALDKNNLPIVDAFAFQGNIIAPNGAKYPLGGINKTYYWFEPSGIHSHIDALFMYTNAWGQIDRSNDGVTNPTEILVQNGIIKEIAVSRVIQLIAPKDGYILRAAGKATDFITQNFKVGDPIRADYKMFGQDPSTNYEVNSFKMMIGGHTIMVDEGKPSIFTRDMDGVAGYRSRTGIGYSKDQRYVYLITADNAGDSKGLSMQEFQQAMIGVGVWKGLNLDGGGSTQMVARPLGDTQNVVVNATEYGTERKIVNGLGVYSLAPKGDKANLLLNGPTQLVIGEKATYQLKAYDQYFNPVALTAPNQTWTMSNPIGTFKDNVFVPTKTGKTTLTVSNGMSSKSIDVEVLGRDQFTDLRVNANNLALIDGGTYNLPVTVTTKNSQTKEIAPEAVQWELKGIDGQIVNGKLTIRSLANAKMAQIIARLDGYSTMTAIPIGGQMKWYNLDTHSVLTTGHVYPQEVVGGVSISQEASGNKKLDLTYDFTNGTGSKAVYADFGGTSGSPIYGYPSFMNMKVEGDGSQNWLRAEFVDSDGKTVKVDLDKNINYTGWKQLSINLADYSMKFPVTIKNIYLVNIEQGQDERALKGKIAIDDISFSYKGTMTEGAHNKVSLTINKTVATLNGKPYTLEQAPINDRGNTLVPIRFVVEALGGQVGWTQEELRATVLKDDKLIELWNNNVDLLVNGRRMSAEVPPRIINNLTMVPLRIVSENLGFKVGWDQATQTVTLQ